MIVKYGSYAHDANENWFKIEAQFRHNSLGLPQSILNRWTIWGTKIGASQSALTTALNSLEAAYGADGLDLYVYLNDGVTATQHFLLNSGSVNGVQVKDISYLDRDPRHGQSGMEYVNKRTYRIVMEAEVVDADASSLISWEERVIGIGTGGPVFIQKGSLAGVPQRQVIQQFSSYQAIQTGRATGYLDYPAAIATPIWPNDEHLESRQVVLETPRFGLVRNTEFSVNWRYQFESASALTGGPTLF